ncbi:MAG: fibronectin type III domain-containing protein [Clostridia bacterium]
MANSGSFGTSGYSGRYLTFNWWTNGRSIDGNYTDIGWNLIGSGGNSGWYKSGNFRVVIDGEEVYYSSARINLYNGTTVASGTKRIYHDNEGNKQFSVYAEAGIYTIAVNCNGSGSWWLDNIPRYLNSINIYNNGNALNSISVKWTCDPRRDWTQYSLNGGGWTDAGDSVAGDNKSGTFNIGGLAPNTSYKVKVRLRRADSGLWSESGEISISTKNKAMIISPGGDFSLNSDKSLTVTCSNPSGNQIAYFLDCPSGTRRLTSGKTTNTSYTWSNAQILSMLQYLKTSNSSSIKVGVITYGNTEYYDEKVGTLNVVNSNPAFSNFVYEDINSKTIALTGNNQYIVKGYSNVRATISMANKAVAKNYATMSKYRFVIGSSQIDVNYSATANVQAIINAVKSNIFTMYAIDSRNNSSFKQISPARYIDYSAITINKVEVIRENGIGSISNLKFNGSIWEGSFGAVLNEIKSCSYKYKETTASTWKSGGTILNPTRNGKSFSFEGLIKGDLGANGFDINKSYNIQVTILDKLTTATFDFILGSGKPGIAITKNGIAINGMYNESLGGALQIWNGDVYIEGIKIK